MTVGCTLLSRQAPIRAQEPTGKPRRNPAWTRPVAEVEITEQKVRLRGRGSYPSATRAEFGVESVRRSCARMGAWLGGVGAP